MEEVLLPCGCPRMYSLTLYQTRQINRGTHVSLGTVSTQSFRFMLALHWCAFTDAACTAQVPIFCRGRKNCEQRLIEFWFCLLLLLQNVRPGAVLGSERAHATLLMCIVSDGHCRTRSLKPRRKWVNTGFFSSTTLCAGTELHDT